MGAFQPYEASRQVEPIGLAAILGAGMFRFDTGGPNAPASQTDSGDELPQGRARWRGGYALTGPMCNGSYTGDPCAHLGPDRDDLPGPEQSVNGMPFIVGVGVKCSAMGGIPLADLSEHHQAADRALELCQWSEVAFELWTGTQAKATAANPSPWPNRYLASDDATVLGEGALTLTEGVASLEDQMGVCMCGGPRVIHVPVKVKTYLAHAHLITQVGQRWMTANGSIVVADDGYPGTGPDGTMPEGSTAWIYATSALQVAIDDAPIHPEPDWDSAFSSTDNLVSVRAQKLAAVTWLCCHFAVLIDYTASTED